MTDREILFNLLKLARQQQRRIRNLEDLMFALTFALFTHAPDIYRAMAGAVGFADDFGQHPDKYLPAGEDARMFRVVFERDTGQVAEQENAQDEWQAWINKALKFLGEKPGEDLVN